MSDAINCPNTRNAGTEFDRSLRLLAHAPVPEGLEDRVKARLAATLLSSAPRKAKLLAWPSRDWLRTAAAAAIAAVVAGGGWGVYSHLVRPLAKNGLATPIHALWTGPAVPYGGFSSAGAMRVPLTVNGLTVTQAGRNAGKKHPNKPRHKMQSAAK